IWSDYRRWACRLHSLGAPALHIVKPLAVDLDVFDCVFRDLDAHLKILEPLNQLFSINQVDRCRAGALSFTSRIPSNRARRKKKALVGRTVQSAPKVTNDARPHGTFVPFALEDHMKRKDPANSDDTLTVCSTITTLAGHLHLSKATLSK